MRRSRYPQAQGRAGSGCPCDAINAYAQSVFWSQVLDFAEDPDDPNEPGHEECLITSRDRSQLLLFITVPYSKR